MSGSSFIFAKPVGSLVFFLLIFALIAYSVKRSLKEGGIILIVILLMLGLRPYGLTYITKKLGKA